jgi:tramtrack
MVLSACSPYFQKLFLNHPEIHPIVILKDIPYTDVKSLLDFMYRGEVSVDQERLTAFLRIAETLKIKGLTEVHEDKPVSAASTPAAASPNLNQINPYISQQQQTQQQQQQQQQQQLRKQQGMALHNPLLGSALTGPKRKRGRPRKFSGSDIGDEYEEFERENLVQGSPELMEMRMGTEGFSTDDNGISRSGDNDDSNVRKGIESDSTWNFGV